MHNEEKASFLETVWHHSRSIPNVYDVVGVVYECVVALVVRVLEVEQAPLT